MMVLQFSTASLYYIKLKLINVNFLKNKLKLRKPARILVRWCDRLWLNVKHEPKLGSTCVKKSLQNISEKKW